MPELIINRSNENYFVNECVDTPYVYTFGGGSVVGCDVININNPGRLQDIALELKEEYSEWIYRLNKIFVGRKIVFSNLSLFLISDISCKRTEIFDTYSVICNLTLIKEAFRKDTPSGITVVGGDKGFTTALKSNFPGVPVKNIKSKENARNGLRWILSDLRFIQEVALIIIFSRFTALRPEESDQTARRYFFTIFPKMTGDDGLDTKYQSLVTAEDRYAASLITDGFHQHLSVWEFFRLRKRAKTLNLCLIDDFLKHRDWCRGVYWFIKIRWNLMADKKSQYQFHDIDITSYIAEELHQSASRLSRFMIIKGGFERFFNYYRIKEFIYYLHEYPFGRLISFLLRTYTPNTLACGYQHGPAAWRKLLYLISPDETADCPDYTIHVPMPQKVLAESRHSAAIYKHSGYRNIDVMDRIYRLDYLYKIKPIRDESFALIAPGLHDGRGMLEALRGLILASPEITFLLKPHPLANNKYLLEFASYRNLEITSDSISNLLSRVAQVFVTYSSVGPEAKALGLSVMIVDIPGVVCESPLADVEQYKDIIFESRSEI